MKTHVETTINGEPVECLIDPSTTLLGMLRNDLGMTGTKEVADQEIVAPVPW